MAAVRSGKALIQLRSTGLSKKLCPMREMGKFLVIIGAVIALAGIVLWTGLAPKWLGRLPGDIRIERGNSAFIFPIVTCIVLSILLSLLLSIFRR